MTDFFFDFKWKAEHQETENVINLFLAAFSFIFQITFLNHVPKALKFWSVTKDFFK